MALTINAHLVGCYTNPTVIDSGDIQAYHEFPRFLRSLMFQPHSIVDITNYNSPDIPSIYIHVYVWLHDPEYSIRPCGLLIKNVIKTAKANNTGRFTCIQMDMDDNRIIRCVTKTRSPDFNTSIITDMEFKYLPNATTYNVVAPHNFNYQAGSNILGYVLDYTGHLTLPNTFNPTTQHSGYITSKFFTVPSNCLMNVEHLGLSPKIFFNLKTNDWEFYMQHPDYIEYMNMKYYLPAAIQLLQLCEMNEIVDEATQKRFCNYTVNELFNTNVLNQRCSRPMTRLMENINYRRGANYYYNFIQNILGYLYDTTCTQLQHPIRLAITLHTLDLIETTQVKGKYNIHMPFTEFKRKALDFTLDMRLSREIQTYLDANIALL